MNHRMRMVLALGATVLFWSSSFPAIRIGLDSYRPAELTLLRYMVASALLVPFALVRRLRIPKLADIPLIFILGCLGITVYHLLLSYGQQTISAGAAGVLSNTSPIFTALLGVTFLGEHLRPIGWVGILVAFVGAGLIATGKDEHLHVDTGAALVVLAAFVWSLYFIGQKKLLVRYNALDLMTCVLWSGTLVLLYFVPAAALSLRSASIEATISAVYLGTFPTIVAYVAWAYVLSQMPVSIAVSALCATPVVAMVLAWLILAEIPTVMMVAGAVLALAGVIIVNVFGRTAS